jgi:hypothetical protein
VKNAEKSVKKFKFKFGGGEGGLGMGERDPDHSGEMTSMFTLESRLSSLNTVEMISAKKKFVPDEVNSTELMNCEQELALGMKSAS